MGREEGTDKIVYKDEFNWWLDKRQERRYQPGFAKSIKFTKQKKKKNTKKKN